MNGLLLVALWFTLLRWLGSNCVAHATTTASVTISPCGEMATTLTTMSVKPQAILFPIPVLMTEAGSLVDGSVVHNAKMSIQHVMHDCGWKC